ncbi:c9f6de18-114c-4566-b1c4-117199d8b410 [Thermothielavioides terrestris]|uniref:C9f6de18-114c-4566-b1c4-117199d8b410 n=1 Tax=Thermothielavioides terrestris TaxID=2587410 RepID=A0A446BX12_9PEZI|nr:c9f6de18-114c-4566-b1c4-117199d8b410 [Thermothielavioides terrestris]
MADQRDKPGLFDSCLIAFVQSKSLSSSVIAQLSQIVRDHGAEVLEPDRKGRIRIPQATHIVSNTIDFDQYAESQAMMIPVVRSEWIKASIARNKVAQVRPFSPDPRMIFSNVILTCADIPDVDKEAITGAIMALGGMESKDLSRQTTHICALSLDHPKCIEAQRKNLKCKIVLPHWFDDCFRLGKRIDEGPYLLPDPEILRKAPEEIVKVPSSQQLEGATSTVPSGPYETQGSEKLVVFAQKKVMLSWDLPISAMLRKTLADKITKGDGEVVDEVEACDMFICQYRDGEQYVRAAQQGKDVGTLAWLYHLMVYNEWTSPFRRLLHYPQPRHGIPGFKDMRITISNYGGEARIYLENLIKAAGATFTKTMKAENTHLITARMHSEKCEAAKDWKIEIVNHLWIEESYAACQALPLNNPKYRHFPPRTNLGEVIGQTFLDEPTLREMYYPGGEENMDETAKKKRRINERAQKNALKVGLDRDFRVMEDSSPAPTKSTTKPRAAPAAGNFVTPAKGRHVRSGKENDTPSVLSSASRSAKAQALSKLQDLAPDIALYEKEKKRSTKDGHGIWGGKRAADQLDKQRADRSSSPASKAAEDDIDDEPEHKRPAKRAKVSLPEVDMRICLTGYKRWVGDKATEEADRRKLRLLGIQIVQENAPFDYLAAPGMIRTMKFLRCLAKGPDVIDSSFITACIETGKRPNIKDHLLVDKANEARFGVSIEKAVSRARANRGRLLWGVPVYCTAEIPNGVDAFKNIAEANGAIFKVYRARSGTTIKPTTEEEDGGADPDPVYLLTGSSPAERQLWPRFEEMARKGHMEPRIVVSDWLLDVAMRQELMFDPKYLMSNRLAEQPNNLVEK